MRTKNFRRKRNLEQDSNPESEDEDKSRLALEEVKFLQKQRERKLGIPALTTARSGSNGQQKAGDRGDGDGEKEDLVLQDTFAQETAVTVEDPNMLKYVEQELAKRRGKDVDAGDKEENDQVDELYVVPEHLKVKKRNSEESSTQWTTGIAEIQLPIEYKLRNIEETEAAKKLLQEKRLVGKAKSELNIPSSYSADYFQRGRDYAEKLRRVVEVEGDSETEEEEELESDEEEEVLVVEVMEVEGDGETEEKEELESDEEEVLVVEVVKMEGGGETKEEEDLPMEEGLEGDEKEEVLGGEVAEVEDGGETEEEEDLPAKEGLENDDEEEVLGMEVAEVEDGGETEEEEDLLTEEGLEGDEEEVEEVLEGDDEEVEEEVLGLEDGDEGPDEVDEGYIDDCSCVVLCQCDSMIHFF